MDKISFTTNALCSYDIRGCVKECFSSSKFRFYNISIEQITKKLSRPQTRWRYGMGYSNRIPSFQKSIDQFIKDICSVEFPMRLHWRKLLNYDSIIKYLIFKIQTRLGINQKAPITRLLVSQDKLVEAAKKLHNSLFLKNNESQPILLNQAGSGWNAIESTKYFANRKVILLTRDPRDQFAELKIIKNARSVECFIDWYKEMKRLYEINDPILLQYVLKILYIKMIKQLI